MRCRKCGKDYPSKYHFKTASICQDCCDKLSPDERKQAVESDSLKLAKAEATTHEVADHQLKCPVCGYDRFWTRRTLMNTPGLTFLGFEWVNKQADNYVCNRRGYVLWFFIEQWQAYGGLGESSPYKCKKRTGAIHGARWTRIVFARFIARY